MQSPAAVACTLYAGHAVCESCAPFSAAEVQGHIDLDVYSEVLGPFKIIPRGVLEAGGNTVMGALVNNLLPVFLRRCAIHAACCGSQQPTFCMRPPLSESRYISSGFCNGVSTISSL